MFAQQFLFATTMYIRPFCAISEPFHVYEPFCVHVHDEPFVAVYSHFQVKQYKKGGIADAGSVRNREEPSQPGWGRRGLGLTGSCRNRVRPNSPGGDAEADRGVAALAAQLCRSGSGPSA